ncbi:MAG: N-acetylmuramoyl-L-alanine amidase, partial [Clostridia bacterium]|nr:N-acetylmuramoyl-L-alanine amidase [Clostridia bacterium]
CIDAGHNYSGFDTGATGNGLMEQDVTFKIADKLKNLLINSGISVTMTRAKITDDVGVDAKDSINQRVRLANTTKCDYFVSIHCNSNEDKSANGTETLICGKGGKAEALAESVNSNIVKYLGLKDRGIKVDTEYLGYKLGVLHNTDMPAILIETAFISNPNDAKLLKEKADEFAKAIFEGFCERLGISVSAEDDTEPEGIVKELQKMIEINDVNAAVDAIKKAKAENSSLYWILYKLTKKDVADTNTPAEEPEQIENAKYSVVGTTHVIEIDPRKIWAVETQCSTKSVTYDNFVNSLFFMNLKSGKTHPQGIMVNAGKVIANNPTHGKPVATLVVYGKDNVSLKYIDDITKENGVWFAVSGYGIYPNITAAQEGFTGAFSDVTRTADRPIIGYRKKDNKIVIAVRAGTSAERAKQTAENLGLDFAISLDGGGSTTLKVNGKYKFTGDGRKIFGGIIWE